MAINLSQISRTTRNSLPPRIIVHGAQKIGKSTFAAGSFSPIFVPTEDGLSGIETAAFPLAQTFEDVMDALEALRGADADEFQTVVVDSLDWFEPMVWNKTCRDHSWPSIEAPGFGKGYAEANSYWRQFFRALDALRNQHGKAIVLIAHSKVKRFESPDEEGYDRYELKLNNGALSIAVEWADIIGFAHERVAIKKEKVGQDNIRSRGVATGIRVLDVNAKPAFIAGNRYNLPDSVPLNWSDLITAMENAPVTRSDNAAEAAA